jgi:hypothetical protein
MSNTFRSHVLIVMISAFLALGVVGAYMMITFTPIPTIDISDILSAIPKPNVEDRETVTIPESEVITDKHYNHNISGDYIWINYSPVDISQEISFTDTSSNRPTSWNWSYSNYTGSSWNSINTSSPNTTTYYSLRTDAGTIDNKYYATYAVGGGGSGGWITNSGVTDIDYYVVAGAGGGGAGGVYINYYNYTRGNI